MSFNAAVTSILPSVPMLTDENWFNWSKKMGMFFRGAGMPTLASGKAGPTDEKLKAEYDRLDGNLVAFIFTKVSPEYQYLVEDCTTGTEAWAALKAHFEKSTMGHRMAARREFYNIEHDPSLSITQYVQSVTAARNKLAAFNVTVDDKEFIDVLLMNLHSSYHHVRSSILMEATEPTADRIKSMLSGSAAATESVSIKLEPDSPQLAHRAYGTGGRMGRSGAGGSAGQVGVSGVRAGRVDTKGFTWSDTTNSSGCHRCGRPGHIAARCMYNMPEHVKEWIMGSGGNQSRSPSPPPKHFARTAMEYAGSGRMRDPYFIDDPRDLAKTVAQSLGHHSEPAATWAVDSDFEGGDVDISQVQSQVLF